MPLEFFLFRYYYVLGVGAALCTAFDFLMRDVYIELLFHGNRYFNVMRKVRLKPSIALRNIHVPLFVEIGNALYLQRIHTMYIIIPSTER